MGPGSFDGGVIDLEGDIVFIQRSSNHGFIASGLAYELAGLDGRRVQGRKGVPDAVVGGEKVVEGLLAQFPVLGNDVFGIPAF